MLADDSLSSSKVTIYCASPARDAYAYGLALLDALFSKDQLIDSLLFKSKRSEKPGLDSAL